MVDDLRNTLKKCSGPASKASELADRAEASVCSDLDCGSSSHMPLSAESTNLAEAPPMVTKGAEASATVPKLAAGVPWKLVWDSRSKPPTVWRERLNEKEMGELAPEPSCTSLALANFSDGVLHEIPGRCGKSSTSRP